MSASAFGSTIAKKLVVALTGLFMVFFLIMHLLGNLEIYSGPDATNSYGALLRTFPKVLWGFRIALIVSVISHVWLTISLTRYNQKARPQAYALKKSRAARLNTRTMMVSGLTVLCFVLYHLAHYTLGITNPEFALLHDAYGRHHVYNMVVLGFSNPLIAGFYILAQALLAWHISHGISSAARTLGLADPCLYKIVRRFGVGLATIIALLFISIPLSVLLGFLPLAN